MKRSATNTQAGVAIVSGLVALTAIAVLSVSNGRAQPPQVAEVTVQPAVPAVPAVPAPVVETKFLMRFFNKPLYMHLKEEMAEEPTDDKAWLLLEQRGLQAAEIANLVAIRPAEPPHEQWLEGAANLQRAGVTFAEAAKTRNWDATTDAYQGLLQRCNECHRARAPDRAPQLKP